MYFEKKPSKRTVTIVILQGMDLLCSYSVFTVFFYKDAVHLFAEIQDMLFKNTLLAKIN